MTAKVILNPYADRWNAVQKQSEVEAALTEAGIDYELVLTKYPGHGFDLATQAVRQGYNPIISAGGDGSVNEVVNGIIREKHALGLNTLPPLGILPLGSVNDLYVNLGLPKDLKVAAQLIAAGNTEFLDLGQVAFGNDARLRYFDNNSAIGLEPTITLIQQKITRLRGVIRYIVATLIGVAKNPQWRMRLEWEDGEYYGPITLVTVGNNPLTGGVFYVTPHADPFDGLLTFVYGSMPTRLKILRLLPRTMKPATGNYVEHPDIHEVHSSWLRIQSDTPTPLHTDGVIQSESVRTMEYSILPGILPVIMNKDGTQPSIS